MNSSHDVWMIVARDHGEAILRAVRIERSSRLTGRPQRRRWASRATGHAMLSLGAWLMTVGRKLECDCEPVRVLPGSPQAA